MIHFIRVLVLAITMLCTYVAVEANPLAAKFVEGIADLPLYEGFQMEGEPLVFDGNDGRIIEVSYISENKDQASVWEYYNSVLPQLGWEHIEDNNFARENELLTIMVASYHDEVHLSFRLAPR